MQHHPSWIGQVASMVLHSLQLDRSNFNYGIDQLHQFQNSILGSTLTQVDVLELPYRSK